MLGFYELPIASTDAPHRALRYAHRAVFASINLRCQRMAFRANRLGAICRNTLIGIPASSVGMTDWTPAMWLITWPRCQWMAFRTMRFVSLEMVTITNAVVSVFAHRAPAKIFEAIIQDIVIPMKCQFARRTPSNPCFQNELSDQEFSSTAIPRQSNTKIRTLANRAWFDDLAFEQSDTSGAAPNVPVKTSNSTTVTHLVETFIPNNWTPILHTPSVWVTSHVHGTDTPSFSQARSTL